jgi:hypothetical protein
LHGNGPPGSTKIGHGTAGLSSRPEPLRLELVEAHTYPSGTAIHVYCRRDD